MNSFAPIRALVKKLVPELTEAMLGNQGIASPKKPYCAYTLISEVGIGQMALGQKADLTPTGLITETIEDPLLGVVQFDFYDTDKMNAQKLCSKFLRGTRLTSSRELLRASGLTIIDHQDYLNQDTFLGDDWERRAMCEVTFNYVESVEDNIPYAELDPADVSATYVDQANQEIN